MPGLPDNVSVYWSIYTIPRLTVHSCINFPTYSAFESLSPKFTADKLCPYIGKVGGKSSVEAQQPSVKGHHLSSVKAAWCRHNGNRIDVVLPVTAQVEGVLMSSVQIWSGGRGPTTTVIYSCNWWNFTTCKQLNCKCCLLQHILWTFVHYTFQGEISTLSALGKSKHTSALSSYMALYNNFIFISARSMQSAIHRPVPRPDERNGLAASTSSNRYICWQLVSSSN